jgi:hypothetical protein
MLVLASLVAQAENWVSVWVPPKPALGGMESFVDTSSIKSTPEGRRATWRMVRWTDESYAKSHPLPADPKAVAHMDVEGVFDCDQELMREVQITMYFDDGSRNPPLHGPRNWSKPVGATQAVYDLVCKAVVQESSKPKP